ncbi:hypothetical protein PF011_g29477 [Phytophthora fragariae]|nr:hypothetical protein PF011_g29477 [Phytophthora fragariae]
MRAGHTLVLSLTPNYWPMVWPSPEPVELKALPLERNLTLFLSETDSSQPMQQLVVKEDQGKDLLVDEGIVMEETATKTYTIDPQCLHPRVSIQRTLTYEKLPTSEHSELLTKFADQVTAATQVDGLKLERTDFAEHPVLPCKVKVETDSSMASDATTFFLKDRMVVHLNDEVFFEKNWEKEITRVFL